KLRCVASNAWNGLRGRRPDWHAALSGRRVPRRRGREVLYRALGHRPAHGQDVVALRAVEALELVDTRAYLLPADRAAVIERLYGGAQLLGLVERGRPIATAWLAREQINTDSVADDNQVSYRLEPEALAGAGRRPRALTQFLTGVRAH